jgi:hypothetical protein
VAETKILIDADDDDRGKRGKRGHRGPEGPTGPTGPAGSGSAGSTGATGPTGPGGGGGGGSGGLLKFSGIVAQPEGPSQDSFLADWGANLLALPITAPMSYPVAIQRTVQNMSVNVLDASIIGDPGGTIVFNLLQNGVPVPGFSITYLVGGPTGVQTVVAGPVTFLPGDTLDLRATAASVNQTLDVSATIGLA